jgi:hypothetical protein
MDLSRITTEEENDRALETVRPLMKKGDDNLSPDDLATLDRLIPSSSKFEDEHYPITRITERALHPHSSTAFDSSRGVGRGETVHGLRLASYTTVGYWP